MAEMAAILVEIAAERREAREAKEREAELNLIKDAASRVTTCDGSTMMETRKWVLHMELVSNKVPAASFVRICHRTVTGGLMFDLERYLEEIATANYGGNQDQVTWVEIRGHVRATFLT